MGRDELQFKIIRLNTCFNPRARMGRDIQRECAKCGHRCFNPRARMGRDMLTSTHCIVHLRVSIHAPAWGATALKWRACPSICLFQSTRPHGARHAVLQLARGDATCFNPRARMGRDSDGLDRATPQWCFNPRARMGRDSDGLDRATLQGVSIHAPAWGATSANRPAISRHDWFQSTRPHGARHFLTFVYFAIIDVSIHAPAWGATVIG